ncbi:MAG: LptF/LptG family permease [Arcobacteraceae bacterium]|nr:LptF/LptG family permease [Arcobacteraceae bacterium]
MSIFTQYLLSKYLKYFFIILLSLEIFFIGIDFLQNMKNLPPSANLQLLYLLYNGFFTLTITLPLSIIFGWIITLTVFIKNNELVSFYSLGISKKALLKPIVNISILITIILIGLQTTPLAYSYEQKSKILNNEFFISEKNDIFLKYNDYFVYFKKLYPIEKKAIDVHIYKIKDNNIIETIIASKAYYQNKKWYVIDAKIIRKPETINWDTSKLEISYEKFLYTLEGFEPKIINNVYKAKNYFSIMDAIYAIVLLENQDFNTNKIKAILYSHIFTPFFVIPMIVLIFLYSGISSRFFNMGQFISISIFSTLTIWGILFLLQKLSSGGVILPELAIILPLLILFLFKYILYTKKIN